MTQKERILRHLKARTITTMTAFRLYGITCLHKRISELRDDGHKIGDQMATVRNRYGQNCRVKMFWLC